MSIREKTLYTVHVYHNRPRAAVAQYQVIKSSIAQCKHARWLTQCIPLRTCLRTITDLHASSYVICGDPTCLYNTHVQALLDISNALLIDIPEA